LVADSRPADLPPFCHGLPNRCWRKRSSSMTRAALSPER
jgi:hypothetical protein